MDYDEQGGEEVLDYEDGDGDIDNEMYQQFDGDDGDVEELQGEEYDIDDGYIEGDGAEHEHGQEDDGQDDQLLANLESKCRRGHMLPSKLLVEELLIFVLCVCWILCCR
jgi:hypothetical protein